MDAGRSSFCRWLQLTYVPPHKQRLPPLAGAVSPQICSDVTSVPMETEVCGSGGAPRRAPAQEREKKKEREEER